MTAIPHYPLTRPLELGDKPLFDAIFARLQPEISEFTFANLYLFRFPHSYRIGIVRGGVVIFGKGYGGEDYFLPPLEGDIEFQLADLFSAGLSLYGADDSFRQRFLLPSLKVVEDRDSFDYVYQRRDLVLLPGNRFHKKKNRINYFTARYSYTAELFDPSHLAGSLRLLDEWARVRGAAGGKTLVSEVEANREALSLAGSLGLQGVVILLGTEVKAFALGERLNRDTSVCHFEKGDPFLEGVSQLVNREFNKRFFEDCTFVNREQDLGEPGLRDAKMSYNPLRLVKKYRARLATDRTSRLDG